MSGASVQIQSTSMASRTYLTGLTLVIISGVCWSLGGILFRLMTSSDVWQVFLYRSFFLLIAMVPIILFAEKGQFFPIFRRAGWNGVIAGFCLALASLGYVMALTYTSVTNAAFMVGSVPFFSALLGWWLLRERVSKQTLISIAIAMIGMGLMVGSGFSAGKLAGNLLALYAALAFACYTVILRWEKNSEMLPSVFWSGIFVMAFATFVLVLPTPFRENFGFSELFVSGHDLALCLVMGAIQLALGLILYTIGAKHVPAAELGLATLIEPVLGTLWVWFFINEEPSAITLTGGIIIMIAITGRAMSGVLKNRLPRTVI